MESSWGSGDAQSVAQALDTLKTTGGGILVVGPDTERAHTGLCQRLCGSSSRYRVFVTVNEGTGCQRPVTRTERDRHIVIDELDTGVDKVPLEQIGLAVIDAIDDLEATAGEFDPGELRVCIDSLVPIVDRYGDQQVFRLVHLIQSRIDQAGGIGHFHLPVDPTAESVCLLEELIDATVKLRTRGGTQQQRWHLHDHGTQTEWLPFRPREDRC